jgi:hypothetical protein
LRGRASVGYTVYTPDSQVPGANVNFQGVYAELDLTHRLNQYVSYTLGGGRSVNFAFSGGTVDLYSLRWQANWNLIHKFTLGTGFEFDHGTQLAFGGETFDRYGPGLTLARRITRKLSAALSYQYFWRGSDVPGRNYTNNILVLNGTYQF